MRARIAKLRYAYGRLAFATCVGAALGALVLLFPSAGGARAARARSSSLSAQEASLLRQDDRGLYVAFCPSGEEVATSARMARAAQTHLEAQASRFWGTRASIAMADHTGWPADECLKMDKAGAGLGHTLVGLAHVHNWLLGGFGNDTFYAGERGDVIWGDYHPAGQPESQSDYIHGGDGEDWIYSSHGFNEIWTGAGNDHLALVYGHGVVYCDGPGVKTFVMRYLPENRPWKLVGCDHKVLDRYRA